VAKLLGCRFRTGISGGGYLMWTKASDVGPNATPDLRGLDEYFPEANAFLPSTNPQFATASAPRPEKCVPELAFIPGLHFSSYSIVSPQKGLTPPKVFHTVSSLPSVIQLLHVQFTDTPLVGLPLQQTLLCCGANVGEKSNSYSLMLEA